MRNNPTLPAYRLAIFEETEEQKAERERQESVQRERDAEAQRDRDAQAQRDRDAQAQRDRDTQAQKDRDAQAEKDRLAQAEKDKDNVRNKQGQFESREDYERRIGELNEENKSRRQENRDLKGTVSVLERRTIMADVRDTISKASPLNDTFSKAAITLFLQEHEADLKIDPKTGDTVGLDKFATWKKANPDFFKPEETDDQKKQRLAQEADAEKNRRGNRSAAGPSRGAGAQADANNTDGLPDLTKLTPAERKKAIDEYTRGLRGNGGTGGYARASSRH